MVAIVLSSPIIRNTLPLDSCTSDSRRYDTPFSESLPGGWKLDSWSWELEVGFSQLCTRSPLLYQGPRVFFYTNAQSWPSNFLISQNQFELARANQHGGGGDAELETVATKRGSCEPIETEASHHHWIITLLTLIISVTTTKLPNTLQ